jgi:hypothetical protein
MWVSEASVCEHSESRRAPRIETKNKIQQFHTRYTKRYRARSVGGVLGEVLIPCLNYLFRAERPEGEARREYTFLLSPIHSHI